MIAKKEEDGKKATENPKQAEDWKSKVQAPPKDGRYKTAVIRHNHISLGCHEHERTVLGFLIFESKAINGNI